MCGDRNYLCSLTAGHGGLLQPMVSSLSGTPSKSLSGLHSLPLPIMVTGHCVCECVWSCKELD